MGDILFYPDSIYNRLKIRIAFELVPLLGSRVEIYLYVCINVCVCVFVCIYTRYLQVAAAIGFYFLPFSFLNFPRGGARMREVR